MAERRMRTPTSTTWRYGVGNENENNVNIGDLRILRTRQQPGEIKGLRPHCQHHKDALTAEVVTEFEGAHSDAARKLPAPRSSVVVGRTTVPFRPVIARSTS
jgi:hypothetical protein